MHHFPFHISDFAQAVSKFSPAQIGVFLVLLMEYYKTERPLPNDEEELFFLTGARSEAEQRTVRFVLKRCFKLSEDGRVFHQRRADREILVYRTKCLHNTYAILCRFWEKENPGHPKPTREQFTANPAKYYDAVTGKIRSFDGRSDLVLRSYDDCITDGIPSSIHDPVTNIHDPGTPVVPKGTDTPELLKLPDLETVAEAIYAIYPRKESRKTAISAIVRVLKAGRHTELYLQERVRLFAAAVAKWPVFDDRGRKTMQFVPLPATWFNQARFDDDPASWDRYASSTPDFGEKKGGGGGGEPLLRPALPEQQSEPEGWRVVWAELYPFPAPESWRQVPKANKEDVLSELRKKGGAAPPDWREWWSKVFTGQPCPDLWEDVPAVSQRRLRAEIAKKEGGAGE